MSFSVFVMPDLPVVVFKAHVDYDPRTEMGPAHEAVLALLGELEGKFYHLVDMTEKEAGLDFSAIQEGASQSARGPNPVFHHPKVKHVVFVTRNPMLKLAVEGMQSEVYGNLVIQSFETLAEAEAFIRRDIVDA